METFRGRCIPGLDGQYAVVTGSTRGNGRAIAEMLAAYGVNVVVTSRSREEAQRVAEEIRSAYDVQTRGVQTDVSKWEQVQALFRETLGWSGGRLDILVNNAGFPLLEDRWNTPLHEIPEVEMDRWFQEVYDVDLKGARYCTRAALPTMMHQHRGSIIFISSTPAISGYQGTPYTEAKAGVLGLMRDVAREYGRYGIRSNAIAPGNIKTEWFSKLTPEKQKALAEECCLVRWGEPREIAGAALFLASDLSSFITGQTLIVDGGTVIH